MLTSHRTLLLIVAFLVVSLQGGWRAKAEPATGARGKTSFGAFQFEIPPKWSNVTPDLKKTAAMLLLNGTNSDNADGMIKVDVGKPALPTAKQLAKALAGADGKVFPDPVSVDGTDGIRVETTSTDLSRPKFAVVVFRDGKVYLIMGGQKPRTDVSAAFDSIIKSWSWAK